MLARFYIEQEKPADGARAMVAALKAYTRAHADEERALFQKEMRRAGDYRDRFTFTEEDVADAVADAPAVVQNLTREVMKRAGGRYVTGKRPVAAALLSLIVGAGQLYNGDYKKAGIMILTMFAALIVSLVPLGCIGAFFLAPVVWLLITGWSVRDAWRVAKGKAPRW